MFQVYYYKLQGVFICGYKCQNNEWFWKTNITSCFDIPYGHQYSAPQSITEKPMEVYYLDEWIIITLHVAGFLHPAIS